MKDGEGSFDDELDVAAALAAEDQTQEQARAAARMFVAFHDELKKGELPPPLRRDLTNRYFVRIMGTGPVKGD